MPELGRRGTYSLQTGRGDLRGGVAITVYVQRKGSTAPQRTSRSLEQYFGRLGLSLSRHLNDRNCMRVVELVRQEVVRKDSRPKAADTQLTLAIEDYIRHLEAQDRSAQHISRTQRRLFACLGRSTTPRAVAPLTWKTLGDVNRRELSAYLVRRRNAKKPAKPEECNHDLRAWRSFMAWCVANDHLEAHPLVGIPQFKREPTRRRVLSAEEVGRLIDACGRATVVRRGKGKGRRPPIPGAPAWLQPAVVVLTYTGMRPSELGRVQWEDVDLEAGMLIVRRKGGDDWSVPISDPLASYLRRTKTADRHGPLVPDFPYHHNTTYGGTYYKAVRTAARNAGLEGVTLYLLRHSAATHLAAAGERAARLQAIFGWRSIQMAQRYVHLAGTDVAGATNALPYDVLPKRKTARG